MGDSPQTAMGYGFKVNNTKPFKNGNADVYKYVKDCLDAATPEVWALDEAKVQYQDEYGEYIDGYLDSYGLGMAYTGYHSVQNAFDDHCSTYIFVGCTENHNFRDMSVITPEAIANLTKVWELFEQKGKPTFDWYVVSYVG